MRQPDRSDSVIARVVRILGAFTPERQALTVSDIARLSNLHVATASRLVQQLVTYGLLSRGEDRRIRVGVRLWELGSRASPTLGLRDVAMPFMEVLHASVGQNTQLCVLVGDEAVVVERLQAPRAVINLSRVGGRLDAHASSSGLVMLAHAPAQLQEKVLGSALRSFTPSTVTDSQALRRILSKARQEGFVICRGYFHLDAAGLAAPIRDRSGQVVAALSAIVPNDDHAARHVPALVAAASGISRALGAPNRPGADYRKPSSRSVRTGLGSERIKG